MSLPFPPRLDDPLRPYDEERPGPLFFEAPPRLRRSWWVEWGRHVVLFVLTLASVAFIGGLGANAAGRFFFNTRDGLQLMTGLMSILFAHEMGHYLACRYYRIDATLPFFIPLPIPEFSLVGTLGAFIRVRSPFPDRRALFDMGIAGPLAGFAVCVPVLIAGALQASIIPIPSADSTSFISLGDPLAAQWAYEWLRGSPPEGMTYLMGPFARAAWFGLFVTALNLIPVGQLDGGHVTYALFGSRADVLSRYVWWLCVCLVYFSPSWILWAVLIRVLGRRHPPTLDDRIPLGKGRVVVALVGLLVFAVCFVPSPILGSWDAIREIFTSR